MGSEAPTPAEVVIRRKVKVAGVLRTGRREVIVDGVEVLRGQKLPRTADVDLFVVDFRVGSGVGVVDEAHIDAEVTERALVSAVEVHLDIAVRIPGTRTHIRVPVAEVDAARVAVIEPALDRRLAEGLVDAAEPVLRGEGDVSGHRRRSRGCLLCLRADGRRG